MHGWTATGAPWDMVSRNYSSVLVNAALGMKLTQLDMVTVSAEEDIGLVQTLGGWNSRVGSSPSSSGKQVPDCCLLGLLLLLANRQLIAAVSQFAICGKFHSFMCIMHNIHHGLSAIVNLMFCQLTQEVPVQAACNVCIKHLLNIACSMIQPC